MEHVVKKNRADFQMQTDPLPTFDFAQLNVQSSYETFLLDRQNRIFWFAIRDRMSFDHLPYVGLWDFQVFEQ